MSSTQLEFGIRTSTRIKNVHLVGSWDNYQRQLPLKVDSRRRDGAWRGVFKFQGSCIVPGTRYWYYYVLDGYQVVHDPSKLATVEPTTGRTLNILDVPPASAPSSNASSTVSYRSAAPVAAAAAAVATAPSSGSRHRSRLSIDVNVARGRALSPDKIVSPKPMKPHESKRIINGEYADDAGWIEQFDRLNMQSRNSNSSSSATSIADSDVPSLTSSRTSDNSTPTSISSSGSQACTCQRYGITRSGHRVKLDCGGTLCGSGDDSSSCSDEEAGRYSRAAPQAAPKLQVLTAAHRVSVNTIVSPLASVTPMRFPTEPISQSKSPMRFAVPPLQHALPIATPSRRRGY